MCLKKMGSCSALYPLWCCLLDMVCKLNPLKSNCQWLQQKLGTVPWCSMHRKYVLTLFYQDLQGVTTASGMVNWHTGFTEQEWPKAHPQFTVGEYLYLGQNPEEFGWVTAHLLSPIYGFRRYNQWYEERSDEDGRHCIKTNRFRRSWLFWKDLENIISLSVTSCPFSRSNQRWFFHYLKQTHLMKIRLPKRDSTFPNHFLEANC